MTITIQDFAQALYLALQEAREEDHDRIINNLVEELRLSDRLGDFEEIIAEFEKLMKMDSGIKDVEVTVNKVAAVNQKLLDELNQTFGSKVNVIEDDTIIGGAVFRVGEDTLIDESVREKLRRMKKGLSDEL